MPVDVSVIMPTFRRPDTLVDAVRSVIKQDASQVEVLVIDDCPDGSAEKTVLGFGDARVRYFRNPEPSGGYPARVRNFGWPMARGEFIHFLDDDDIVPQGHYAAIRAAFARMPNVGVVFGRIEGFGVSENQVRSEQRLFADAALRAARSQRFGASWIWTSRLLFQPLMFVGGAAVVRRRCVEAMGGYDTSLEVMEDVDFYARTIREFGAYFIDRVALRYRIGPSIMHRAGIQAVMDRSYVQMQDNFRRSRGALELFLLKVAARTVLRFV